MFAFAAPFSALVSITTEGLPPAFTDALAVDLHLEKETSLLFW
jgi:hypothetical protein